MRSIHLVALALLATSNGLDAQSAKPRSRELGFAAHIGGTPGALDAITDVAGVEVGHTTLVSGSGRLAVGAGPVRTGVTVVHPRGRASADPVSTANTRVYGDTGVANVAMLPNARINPLFAATVQATEAAIVNAMLAAETMTGRDEFRVHALPHDRLMAAMRKYGRN